ncbi:UDP-galactose transporter 1 [Tanacetum coccineum]
MVWRKYFDWRIWASLVPIVGGILLTSVTELSFNMFGFCAALFGCLATSTKTILAESLLHGYKFDSINTVYYMAPFATMILAVPALLLEGAGVVQWIQTHPTPMSAIIIIIGSGVTAFCLNFSIFYVIHSTTAVTFNVAGNLKVVNIKLLWHCIAFPSIVETSPVDSRGGKRVVTSPINNELDKVLCDFKTGSINSRLKFAIGSSNEQCSNGCPLIKRINANDDCNGSKDGIASYKEGMDFEFGKNDKSKELLKKPIGPLFSVQFGNIPSGNLFNKKHVVWNDHSKLKHISTLVSFPSQV